MSSLAEQTSKQNEEIRRLKKQLAEGTTPQIEGLLEEGKLLEHLRKLFPRDGFAHTGKGGDIVQTVYVSAKQVGVIVYECKREEFSACLSRSGEYGKTQEKCRLCSISDERLSFQETTLFCRERRIRD